MTKKVTFSICDTVSSELLGRSHKVMSIKDTPEFELRCKTWFDSFCRGLFAGKNLTLQISVEDFDVPVQLGLF